MALIAPSLTDAPHGLRSLTGSGEASAATATDRRRYLAVLTQAYHQLFVASPCRLRQAFGASGLSCSRCSSPTRGIARQTPPQRPIACVCGVLHEPGSRVQRLILFVSSVAGRRQMALGSKT